MKTTIKILLLIIGISITTGTYAQERLYKDGTVWTASFIKPNPGKGEDYLNNLKTTWKAVHDEAIKQGLILSYKILDGMSANPQDFNILLLVEYKNLAALEGNDDKWDAIYKKVIGDEQASNKLMETRSVQRTIYGEKLFREVVYK